MICVTSATDTIHLFKLARHAGFVFSFAVFVGDSSD